MNILFLCVANSARSQIAEGLAKQILAGSANIQSAGSKPGTQTHSLAIQVMNEIGIDISKQNPKLVYDLNLESFDLIITLCAEESCPVVSSKAKKLNWNLSDPANPEYDEAKRLDAFRNTRDEIKSLIQQLSRETTSRT
ncbi:MAG: arsenate reductase ArsC [Bdellovibrionales bacterium]